MGHFKRIATEQQESDRLDSTYMQDLTDMHTLGVTPATLTAMDTARHSHLCEKIERRHRAKTSSGFRFQLEATS